MRIVRLVALFLGLGLIVASVAGFVARRAEMARDRDRRVEAVAEVAAAEISVTIELTAVAAELADDPVAAVDVLARVSRSTVACGAVGDAVSCTQVGGTDAGSAVVDAVTTAVRAASGGDGSANQVEVVGGHVVVVASGATVVTGVAVPIDALAVSVRDAAAVDVAVVPTDPARGAGLTTGDGTRTVELPLAVAPEWSVAAAIDDTVTLPDRERTVLVVVAALGALLLVFAGVTLLTHQRRLVERASVDPVTRLPNRSEFEVRGEAMLQLARRNGDGVCVMLVDLDGFKAVNDTYGHRAGDEVLRVVGMRLRSAVRGYDLVARWGGDEFVIVLPGIGNETFATSRAESLAALVSDPMRADDTEAGVGMRVGASIGIALLGEHGDSLGELVSAADAAMYAAKREGSTHRMAVSPAATGASPPGPSSPGSSPGSPAAPTLTA